jgi:hypothetical protein
MSLPVLSNQQIIEMCSNIPSFEGCPLNKELGQVVLTRDMAKRDLAWIILYLPLEGSENTVGHWVLLWSPKRGIPVFFDSFGAPPSKGIMKFLRRLHGLRGNDKSTSKVPFESNNTVLQDIDASSCGYWCMSLLYALSTGSKLSDFVSNFTDDFDENEQVLLEIFNRE